MQTSEELKADFFEFCDTALADILDVLPFLGWVDNAQAEEIMQARRGYAELPTDDRRSIACDPRTVSSIHQLNSLIGAPEQRSIEKLLPLLIQIKRLALSVAYFRRSSFIYEAQPGEWNSFALPGTSIYLQHDGSSSTQIYLVQGTRELESRAFKLVDLRSKSQDVYLARPEQALQPPWTHERLLSFEAVEDEWPSALEQAVRILEIVPDAYRLVRDFGSMVVPIQNEDRSVMSSVSFDSHPSAVFTSWCDRVEMLAETLVHESDHQRFYLASRLNPVWTSDAGLKASIYRSPWRTDPRPLDGILRGACAFDSVSSFWVSVLERGGAVKAVDQKRWVIERAVYTNYQAIDAIQTILEFGSELSKGGLSLVGDVVRNLKGTRDRLLEFAETPRCTRRAEELQVAHDINWKHRNRAPHLKSTTLSFDGYMAF